MLIIAAVMVGCYFVGFFAGKTLFIKNNKAGKLILQNEDPKRELLELRFEGDVDSILFEKDYAVFLLDRKNLKDV